MLKPSCLTSIFALPAYTLRDFDRLLDQTNFSPLSDGNSSSAYVILMS